MKKTSFVVLCALFSDLVGAQLREFPPKSQIKSSDINSNFNHIQQIFQSKDIPLSFKTFEPGQLIKSSEFENEFDKVRALDIEVTPLDSITIKSSELNTAFSQMAQGATAALSWPYGNDGSLSLSAGNYQISKSSGATTLEVVNTDSSAVIKSGIGSYSVSGETAGTCQVDFDSLTINSGATLKLHNECKWLVLGVKNNAEINGQLLANNLVSAGTWTTRTPDYKGQLTGEILSSTIVQKNGAKGSDGTPSSSANTFGLGGISTCGYGGGGGGGAGVNNTAKYLFSYTGANQPFTVPSRITSMRFKLWGAGGAGDSFLTYNNGQGGGGGAVDGKFNTTPGEVLNIVVGGGGAINSTTPSFGSGGLGQYAGGNVAKANTGGLSGIFKGAGSYSQATTVAIAGGGGSASSRDGWSGGAGGYPGQNSNEYNRGLGATISGPGCNDAVSGRGARGTCGSGFAGGTGGSGDNGGGGGGGGYFGGGAGNGGTAYAGGGGGGGLSYMVPSQITSGTYLNGNWRTPGNTSDPDYVLTNSAGYGGTSGAGNPGYAILLAEGTEGENGTNASCGAAGIGGKGSVNNGGLGGNGGKPGTHGQSIFLKVAGNLTGSGKISVSGAAGENGIAGAIGGTSGAHVFGNGGTGGGGAGGSAGKIVLRHKGTLGSVAIEAKAGIAGTGGSGAQNGEAGLVESSTF